MDSNNPSWTPGEWYTIIQGWRVNKPIILSNKVMQQPSSASSLASSSASIQDQQQQQQQQQGQQQENEDQQQQQQQQQQTQQTQPQPQTPSSQDQSSQNVSPISSSSLQQSASSGASASSLPQPTTILSENNVLSITSTTIVEGLLKTLKSERDDILRINLLLFLSENCTLLLEEDIKRFEKVFSILQSLINSQVDSYPVKTQVLTTMTTILICESIIKTHPRLVETFTDLLLDIVSKTNNSSDRLLRGSACLCLLELELTYPCLLSAFIPSLLSYVQLENTHLIQQYTQLFTTVLQNAVICEHEELVQQHHQQQQQQNNNNNQNNQNNQNNTSQSFKSPTPNNLMSPPPTPSNQSSLNYRRSLSRIPSSANLQLPSIFQNDLSLQRSAVFTIPQNIKYAPIVTLLATLSQQSIRLSESVGKELLKCISVVVDQSPQLNSFGLISIILQLVPLIDIASIPHTVFRHPHLYKLFFTRNPQQFHLLLYLALKFPDVYTMDEFDMFFNRLIFMMNDVSLPLEHRILAIDWLLSIPNKLKVDIKPMSIIRFYNQFYPTSFDTITLKEVKLYAMCKCILDNNKNITNKSIPPNDLMKSLICLDEFRYHLNEHSQPTKIVFSILLLYLESFSSFSIIFKNIESFLSELLLNYPQFLNSIISLMNGIPDKKTKIHLFLSLSRVIVSLGSLKFLHYLPLVERIVLEDQINPTLVLNKICDLVRRKSICGQGNWTIGNMIISICRRTLITHNSQPLFKPLRLILCTLANYFSNVEIRDRASFYDRLLTHLPDDKIKTLLISQGNQSNHQNVIISSTTLSKVIKSHPNFVSISQITKPIIHHFNIGDVTPVIHGSGMVDDFEKASSQYQQMLAEHDRLCPRITIPYRIRYMNQLPANVPTKIYALLIRFRDTSLAWASTLSPNNQNQSPPMISMSPGSISPNTTTPLSSSMLMMGGKLASSTNVPVTMYSPINPIRIPYLCYSSKEDELEFPYSFDIDITFSPKYPIPSTFNVKMVFNDDEGRTCKSSGSQISIQFHHLFMEIPIPITSPQIDSMQFKSKLFKKFWKLFDQDSKNLNNSTSLISVKNMNIKSDIIEKSIQLNQNEMEEEIEEMEEMEEIGNNNNNNGQNSGIEKKKIINRIKLMMFLPPQFHLLLLFEISKDATIVTIKTDCWKCLTFIDQFLLSI
ncbi:hypothetical protein DFA_01157 [Cavenderia fasciculata]|uniref:AP-5 complex subunit beta-1 n=1 Tax=Cavenderia fasciculata TaxID=261658 RepID=F4PR77_CACFS|nr:uncharacterized protein DFA_01157 [Cavenderia fasciculata]EGG21277.1 hypothetical protein DFA_01157 [Cavenderia fasciculata]|eukprot:XP_004359127.1 hypothetical protein DFA_01157 [Cavenderia fasciculata]